MREAPPILREFARRAGAALAAAASVGLVLAVLGGVLQGLRVEVPTDSYWRFAVVAALVAGGLLAPGGER